MLFIIRHSVTAKASVSGSCSARSAKIKLNMIEYDVDSLRALVTFEYSLFNVFQCRLGYNLSIGTERIGPVNARAKRAMASIASPSA